MKYPYNLPAFATSRKEFASLFLVDSIVVVVIDGSAQLAASEPTIFVAVVGTNAFFTLGPVASFYVGVIVRVADF